MTPLVLLVLVIGLYQILIHDDFKQLSIVVIFDLSTGGIILSVFDY